MVVENGEDKDGEMTGSAGNVRRREVGNDGSRRADEVVWGRVVSGGGVSR